MADRGVEAMIESTDDMVCGVGIEVAKEAAFAAPNSASVLCIHENEKFPQQFIHTCIYKLYLENLNINGIHRYHKRNQGICNGRLIVENSTSGSWSGFLICITN